MSKEQQGALPQEQFQQLGTDQLPPAPQIEAPSKKRKQKDDVDDLDDDDSDDGGGDKKSGRRKINIEFIEDKSRRHITFSKRKAGIMKKAYELSTLTGTQVLLLVASETGHVYTFATPKLQPLITKTEGKNLIQACLNSSEGPQEDSPPPRPQAFDQQSESSHQESEKGEPQRIPVHQAQPYPASQYPVPVHGISMMPGYAFGFPPLPTHQYPPNFQNSAKKS